jgi:hypothetical protein
MYNNAFVNESSDRCNLSLVSTGHIQRKNVFRHFLHSSRSGAHFAFGLEIVLPIGDPVTLVRKQLMHETHKLLHGRIWLEEERSNVVHPLVVVDLLPV